MSQSLFPDLEQQLLRAAARTSRAPHGGRRRSRWRGRAGLFVALAALTTASGIAAAAHGLWAPQLGDARWGIPHMASSPVPSDQFLAFAALRRPQTAQDRGPAARRVLHQLGGAFDEVRTADVRVLGALPGGRSIVLVPVRQRHPSFGASRDELCVRIDDPAGGNSTAGTCADAWGAVHGNLEIGADAAMTVRQRAAMHATLADAKARGEVHGPITGHDAQGTYIPQPVWHRMMAAAGQPNTIATGVVPDGVVRITIGRHAAVVHDNTFFITLTAAESDARPPEHWYGASGEDLTPRCDPEPARTAS